MNKGASCPFKISLSIGHIPWLVALQQSLLPLQICARK